MADRHQAAQQEADADLHQAREAFNAAMRQAEEAFETAMWVAYARKGKLVCGPDLSSPQRDPGLRPPWREKEETLSQAAEVVLQQMRERQALEAFVATEEARGRLRKRQAYESWEVDMRSTEAIYDATMNQARAVLRRAEEAYDVIRRQAWADRDAAKCSAEKAYERRCRRAEE